jgi:tetratricopeptide (TPR) repeat protein
LHVSTSAAQEATDYASHFNHGQELLQQMRFHDAAEEFRESARINPDYLPAQQALAVTYALSQNFAMAWKQVRLLQKSHVELPKEFLETLRDNLSETDAGKQLEDTEKALAAAQRTASERPEDAAAQASLATALNKAGDYSAAQRTAELALVLDSTNPEAHLLLGTMLAGDPPNIEEAIPHLRTYLQHAPQSTSKDTVRAYWMLGDTYRRSGRERQALQTYEEGLKTATDEEALWNNASWLYSTARDASLRDPQKALAYARKAVALSGGLKANCLDTLAEALYANGLFDEAVATEKKAVALRPGEGLYPDQLKRFQAAKDHEKETRQ